MLSLNYRDARPIYEQVRDGLRHLVVTGAIAEGEELPSVRALAATLAINPNTIQRAYSALEQEGYLETHPGKGSFAAHANGKDNARKQKLLQQFDTLTIELLFLGLTVEELSLRVSQAAAQNTDNTPSAALPQESEEEGRDIS